MFITFLALLLSAVAAAGSLYMSLQLGQKLCPLCYYERAFSFALVGMLLPGLLVFRKEAIRLCILALPLGVAGFGVAGFHVYLEMSGALECPTGIENIGTVAQQSLGIYSLILLTLLYGTYAEVKLTGDHGLAAILGLFLGAGAAYGSISANPDLPEPTGAYPADQKFDTCRKPFVVK